MAQKAMIGNKIVLGPIRVKGRRMRGPQRSLKVESKRARAEAALRYDEFLVRIPEDAAETVKAIAKYEERSRATVLRSLVLLGLRVYRQLDEGISPYAPAHSDVTDDEIKQTANAIRIEAAKRHSWGVRHAS